MNRVKTLSVDLLNGPIMKNLLIFMLPILVSYVFQQLYNAVDTSIVGHFLGEQSLAAVGANIAIFDLMVGFAQGLGSGVCIVVSRAYGAADESGLRRAVAGSLVIGAATVALMTILSLLGLSPLLRILGTPDSIYAEACSYIRIIGGGIFVMFAYNLFSSLLRAIGNSAMSLVFLIISSVLNVLLDLLLVGGTGLGEKTTPLVSSFIELVGKCVFTWLLVPRMGYQAVILCEPLIWCVMTAHLLFAFFTNGYIRGESPLDNPPENA